MDLKALGYHRLSFCLILLFEGVASTQYATDNEGLPPCFPEEFLKQVRCCDKVDSIKYTIDVNNESIEKLEKRLESVNSFAKDVIGNVSAQSLELNSKLSETYKAFVSETLQKCVDSQRATQEKVDRLSSESLILNTSSQRVEERLDSIAKDLKTTKKKEEECPQVLEHAVKETHSTLMKKVVETSGSVEDLKEKLRSLKNSVSAVDTKITSAEADLQQLSSFIKKLCLPPFSWQGDGCYYFPFTKKSWQKAREFCFTIDADLVVPQDYLHFVNWLPSLNLDDDVWIGATDSEKEGTWVWINGEPLDISPDEFFNWEDNNKENEDCIEICSHSGYRPTDMDCDHENYFICQKAIK